MEFKVSVIIPTYNRGQLISDSIESVINQTYKNWELIIVDDGSTDNTAEIVNQYVAEHPNIFCYKRPSHKLKGANSCRNFGFEVATGKFVKFFDSDDLLAPKILEAQVEQLTNHPDADVSFCNMAFFTKNDGEIVHLDKMWSKILISEKPVEDYIYKKLRWQTAAGLWKKTSLDTEPFQEGLMNSQEWLMHLKYLLRDIRIVVSSEIGGYIRVHRNSMSNNKNKGAAYYYHQCYSRYLAIADLSKSPYNNFHLKRTLLKFIGWNYMFIVYNKGFLPAMQFLKFTPKLFSFLLAGPTQVSGK